MYLLLYIIVFYSHIFSSPWYTNIEYYGLIELHTHHLKYEKHYKN